MNSFWDVAVIGGGPAGSASAISLRQTFPSLRVLLIEASEYGAQRSGEVLPPLARGVLEHLGVLKRMDGAKGTPACGVSCAWGSPRLEDMNYFLGAAGEGWHLDRMQFDALLADEAEARGTVVWRNVSLRQSLREDNRWMLHLSGGKTVSARWVIDATGRKAVFARMRGAGNGPKDQLMAFSRVSIHRSTIEARTVIEACPYGWWYTAPLPNGRRVASLLTDADIGRSLRLGSDAGWRHALLSTEHVQELLDDATAFDELTVHSAATVALKQVYGDGWVAAGDAAAAYDPLSARGITNALRSGILASFAIGDALCHNDSAGLARYGAIVETQRSGFARSQREHYAKEQRWCDEPFWMRRQEDASRLVPAWAEASSAIGDAHDGC